MKEFEGRAKNDSERRVLALLHPDRIPRHIAVIMDGNGRWARRRRLPRLAGHRSGMETVRRTIEAARDVGTRYLTLYAFSSENWTRPRKEISGLMRLLKEYLRKEVDELDTNNIRLMTIGRTDQLPKYALSELERAKRRLDKNTGQVLILALNYGGRGEIADSARRLAAAAAAGEILPEEIDEEMIEANLDTAGIPDPDLIIRTSGEFRLSNFLLWQSAYAELWITPTLWPDFKREDFFSAVADYGMRERRFGDIGPPR